MENKIQTVEQIDKVVSAELPDPRINPELFDMVYKHMIHRCNPKRCHDEHGMCKKKFPHEFVEETTLHEDGWPQYRRRRSTSVTLADGTRIDNSCVVPYDAKLLLEFDAHINLHVSALLDNIKYLYKYLAKGPIETATVAVTRKDGTRVLEYDEIRNYETHRCVGAVEACWRIFGFALHKMSHHIERLPVHLEGHQLVQFAPGNEQEAIDEARDTRLMAWFKLNQSDPEARKYLYSEIPGHYFFKNEKWIKRRKKANTLARLANVYPTDIERFSLRLLILNVRGAESYQVLRNGKSSFREAAVSMGLISNNMEWDMCMEEASHYKFPKGLRLLFAVICAHCAPSNAKDLWEKFKHRMTEDYTRNDQNSAEAAEQMALWDIESNIKKASDRMSLTQLGFELFDFTEAHIADDSSPETLITWGENLHKLNVEQTKVFDSIMCSLRQDTRSPCSSKLFYIDGPGGSGKTFLYNCLIASLKASGKTVICTAFTGIAASQLIDGMTLHTTFSIPVGYESSTLLPISPSSQEAERFKNASLLVVDEAPMVPLALINIIDQQLKDITGKNLPFGGKVVVFGGDFRQCLPILSTRDQAAICGACIQAASFWEELHFFTLKRNMRSSDPNSKFSEWLLDVGNGVTNATDNIPMECMVKNENMLISEVFGKFMTRHHSQSLSSRCILALTNRTVARLNEAIITSFRGRSRHYYSVDSVDDSESSGSKLVYSTELLNSLEPNGFPPHDLHLKVGCCIMLIRNLNIKEGLCNGTRLIVSAMERSVIVAQCLPSMKFVYIPRIPFITNVPHLHAPLKRQQFPVKLAYSMTVNKSQGQTFERVGLCLDREVFSHGQLYVGVSRTRSFDKLRIYHPAESQINNIVYKEILISN